MLKGTNKFNLLRPEAKIAVVKEMPSVEDEARGVLFQSKHEERFWQYMAKFGVSKHNVSMLTLLDQRIPGKLVPTQGELMLSRELLKRDLAKINPNIIAAIGEYALNALTPFSGIDKYRGSVLQSSITDAKVIAMLPTARLFSQPDANPTMQWDIQKLLSHADTKDLMRKDLKIFVTDDLMLYESEFLSNNFVENPDSLLSFDIECCDGIMTCIGFAKDPNHAYVMPLALMENSKVLQALKLIDKILRSKVKKVAQNGNFDVFFLGYYYKIRVNNFWWDTMLCQHSMYANLPKGLDYLSSIYTNNPYWKDEGKQWKLKNINWDQFFDYNGKDVANTLEIALEQMECVKARGTNEIFRHEMNLCEPLVTIELKGMKINRETQRKLIEKNALEISRAQMLLNELVGFELNTKSPKQMKEFLYNSAKFPKRVKKGVLNTDKDALLSLMKYDPKLIKLIMYLQDVRTQKGFAEMKTDADGRVRTNFKAGGTTTGRLASAKSIIGTGRNLQNIPKPYRVMFVPDEDYFLIQVDYGKAESWVVAYLAQDERMLEALAGVDFHSTNASNILGKPVTKANYSDRQLGKRISHASNYGMTEFLLQRVLVRDGYIFSKEECRAFIDMYFACYPKIRTNYHNWIQSELRRDRTLTTPFGRKITFWEFWGPELLNAAYAYIPQSTVGDMTNMALNRLYRNIPKDIRFDLLLQVHDSIVMQVHKDDFCPELITNIRENMTIPITIKGQTFTVPIDVEFGLDWYNLHDCKKVLAQNESNIISAIERLDNAA